MEKIHTIVDVPSKSRLAKHLFGNGKRVPVTFRVKWRHTGGQDSDLNINIQKIIKDDNSGNCSFEGNTPNGNPENGSPYFISGWFNTTTKKGELTVRN